MNQNYTVLYATFRRYWADQFMINNAEKFVDMELWHTGSGEWQVRLYR